MTRSTSSRCAGESTRISMSRKECSEPSRWEWISRMRAPVFPIAAVRRPRFPGLRGFLQRSVRSSLFCMPPTIAQVGKALSRGRARRLPLGHPVAPGPNGEATGFRLPVAGDGKLRALSLPVGAHPACLPVFVDVRPALHGRSADADDPALVAHAGLGPPFRLAGVEAGGQFGFVLAGRRE